MSPCRESAQYMIVCKARARVTAWGICHCHAGPQIKSDGSGHSLGGALATLAACEIAKACPAVDVACYTFGAPRTGNHAFARCDNMTCDPLELALD